MKKGWFVIPLLCVFMALPFGCVALSSPYTQTLRDGQYKVGEDVPVGQYTIKCTDVVDLLGDYMGAMQAIAGDDEEVSALFGLFGSMASMNTPTMSVKVVGPFGEEINSFEMVKDDTRSINLEENTAIKIEGGTCTIEGTAEEQPSKSLNAEPEAEKSDTQEVISTEAPKKIIETSWGDSKEKIITEMNSSGDESIGKTGLIELFYEQQPISKYEAGLTYYFKADQLVSKEYLIKDSPERTFSYLADALASKYGEATDDVDECVSIYKTIMGDEESSMSLTMSLNFLKGFGTFKSRTWYNDDTIIVLILDLSKEENMLFYCQNWKDWPKGEMNTLGL